MLLHWSVTNLALCCCIIAIATFVIPATTGNTIVTHGGSHSKAGPELHHGYHVTERRNRRTTAPDDDESEGAATAGDIYGEEREVCFRRQEADSITLACDNQNTGDAAPGPSDQRIIILDAYLMSNLTADYDFKFLHKGYTPYVIPRSLAARRGKSNAACWSHLRLPEPHRQHHPDRTRQQQQQAQSQDRLNCVEDLRSTFNSK